MATKFAHIDWICLTLLDGDPSITTKFDYHRWMGNKMDSLPTIRWQPKPFLSPSDSVIVIRWRLKMEEYNKPLLLGSVPHKDGQLKKIWSSSNCHNFLDVDWSFFSCQKRGACHMFFWKPFKDFQQNHSKNIWQPPFCGNWNTFAIWKIWQ